MPNQEVYQSPFTWRYGSDAMRSIWSDVHKRKMWRQVWVALAQAQAYYGLIDPASLDILREHAGEIDIERALSIEAEIHHDLMAELKTFAGQCGSAGGVLHLGATSMDIEDNAEVLRIRRSLDVVLAGLKLLLDAFASQIDRWADLPVMAFTHLQPAEPTTLGYRLAFYAQDLLEDWKELSRCRSELRGKGFTGAVGTSAAYGDLIGKENLEAFQQRMGSLLDLSFFDITSQVYPRKQDYRIIAALAGLGASLYKFAFDLRMMQSPLVGEWSEPFRKKQVGSSAMPFKRNPINAEKIDSLARLLAGYPHIAWDNAAHSLLERTLDDSANRRTLLPESFLIADELLMTSKKLVSGLVVNEFAVQRNLGIYGPFAATERVLAALAKAGADRQAMHEHLREISMQAWELVMNGEPNPLVDLIARDPEIQSYLDKDESLRLMDVTDHLGDAPKRARRLAAAIRQELEA